jgi:penicillin V acylase-like amidase (Ntn superfamily)
MCSVTRWSENVVYYFESTTSPNIIWVKLNELNFKEGSPVKKLDLVNQPDRIGDASDKFDNSEPFEWAKPIDQ